LEENEMKETLQEIYIIAKDKNLKIRFFFKGVRYILCINGLIRARDKNFNIVPWSLAFGSKTPYSVLQTISIEKIEVENKDGDIMIFEKLDELISWLKKIRYEK